MSEPSVSSLKEYDHETHGPFLGVSDDGRAADDIRRAALSSPKLRVLGPSAPIVVGVAQDAERLVAVGETAVGPDEYREIRLACHHSILSSTNVGTRLNLRYFNRRPVVDVRGPAADRGVDVAIGELRAELQPFVRTPNGRPVPATLFLRFSAKLSRSPSRLRGALLSCCRQSRRSQWRIRD